MNKEILYYDLTLTAGDTFYVQTLYGNDSVPLVVESVYSANGRKIIKNCN